MGSNKGKKEEQLQNSVLHIEENLMCKVEALSSFYETKPYGYTEQENFLNAVVKIKTGYSPLELFSFLKQVEEELGRKESVRWGPREIDLDILFYNSLIYNDESLTIPHEGIALRDFVLVPMCEIAPDFVHPVLNVKICDLELPKENTNIINKYYSDVLIK